MALVLLLSFLLLVSGRDGWWRQLPVPGPDAKTRNAATAAVVGNAFYVVGGSGVNATDKWIPDINSWERLSQGFLPVSLTYSDVEAVGGMLILFGGFGMTETTAGYFDTLYALQPTNPDQGWVQKYHDGSIPERSGHTATNHGGVVYVFAGWNSTMYFNDLWSCDTTRLTRGGFGTDPLFSEIIVTPPTSLPPARDGHTTITTDTGLLVFGGFFHDVSHGPIVYCDPGDGCIWYNDLWSFDVSAYSWTKLNPSGPIPTARHLHTANVIGDRMIVFGGNAQIGDLNDLWSYSITRNEWQQLLPAGNIPAARNSHVAGVVGSTLYIYAGSLPTTDIWSFTLNVEQSTSTSESESVNLKPVTGGAAFSTVLLILVAIFTVYTIRKATSRDAPLIQEP